MNANVVSFRLKLARVRKRHANVCVCLCVLVNEPFPFAKFFFARVLLQEVLFQSGISSPNAVSQILTQMAEPIALLPSAECVVLFDDFCVDRVGLSHAEIAEGAMVCVVCVLFVWCERDTCVTDKAGQKTKKKERGDIKKAHLRNEISLLRCLLQRFVLACVFPILGHCKLT